MLVSGDRLITLFLGWVTARAVPHRGWWVVVSLYVVVDARLTPAELLVMTAAQGLASVVFEVPAGVLADTVSRKGAIVLAHLLMGVAMIATGLFPRSSPCCCARCCGASPGPSRVGPTSRGSPTS